MEVETEMGQPLVAVCRERTTHLVRRPDEKRAPAMSDARYMAELADRREIVEHAGCGGRRLRVHPRSVEMEDLMQAGLGLGPSLLAGRCDVDADRDRSDLARRPVIPELAEKLLVLGVTAAGPGRQVIAAPRRPLDTLVAHRGHPDRRPRLLHRCRRHTHIGEVVIFAFVAEFLSGKAALDDPERFEGPPEPRSEEHTAE